MEKGRNEDYLEIGDSRIPTLLTVIEQSEVIRPAIYEDVLLRQRSTYPHSPWSGKGGKSAPPDYLLMDMHRELAIESLDDAEGLEEGQLERFRRHELDKRLDVLGDSAWPYIKFSSQDPATIQAESDLYHKLVEFYLDRCYIHDSRSDLLRQDLRYVEILAGKLALGARGLVLPFEYQWEILDSLVEVYEQGAEDVIRSGVANGEDHARTVRGARDDIRELYSPRSG